jgi:hypothetical protein
MFFTFSCLASKIDVFYLDARQKQAEFENVF